MQNPSEHHLKLDQVYSARKWLHSFLPQTRLLMAPSLSQLVGANVYLKLESELPTGSFKPRGALWALHQELSRGSINEVVAASTGNHGAAVAYAARQLNVPATIFLPQNPNPVKHARIADLGAGIKEAGRDKEEALQLAKVYANTNKAHLLTDATDLDIPAATATIACEILDQLSECDVIYCPVGDSALIRGVASAAKQLKQGVKIIGVQAEQSPAYYLSWKDHRVITTSDCETIADGLATRIPMEANVQAIIKLVDEMCLVSEAQMLKAVKYLLIEEHIVAEPSGAATTAALLGAAGPALKNVVLIVTGANVPEDILRRTLNS